MCLSISLDNELMCVQTIMKESEIDVKSEIKFEHL